MVTGLHENALRGPPGSSVRTHCQLFCPSQDDKKCQKCVFSIGPQGFRMEKVRYLCRSGPILTCFAPERWWRRWGPDGTCHWPETCPKKGGVTCKTRSSGRTGSRWRIRSKPRHKTGQSLTPNWDETLYRQCDRPITAMPSMQRLR